MTLKAVAGNDPSDFVLSWLVADSVRCGVMHIEGIENMTATNTKVGSC